MNRLYSITVPLLLASSGAIPTIPTIPTLGPPGPLTSGIVAMEDGTVYFVDSFSDVVWRLQPGNSLSVFVSGRNGRVLCTDDHGHLYGTHRDESGRMTTWRADGSGTVVDLDQWFTIGGMTRTPEGDVLVASGSSIRRVSQDGTVRTIVKDERLLEPRHSFLARLFGAVHGHLTGIAVGARGEIFVANSSRDAIIRIGRDGNAKEFLKSENGWTPTGVATANGSLYVLEYGHGVRVRRLDADGTLTVVALVTPERPVAAAQSFGRFLIPAAIS